MMRFSFSSSGSVTRSTPMFETLKQEYIHPTLDAFPKPFWNSQIQVTPAFGKAKDV